MDNLLNFAVGLFAGATVMAGAALVTFEKLASEYDGKLWELQRTADAVVARWRIEIEE